MNPADKFADNFCCPKCQGRKAETRCVTLPGGGLPHILALSQGKYVLVSCGLCGFTEIYSLSAYATREETAPADAAAEPASNHG